MADQEIDVTPETPVAPAAEAKPSIEERLGAIVDRFSSQADAEETAAEEKPGADGTTTPSVATDQAGAKGTEVEAKPVTPPEKLVLTPDQLKDTATWGALDADGWQRMERDYPVETKLVKAAQAAASRIVNAARKEAPPPQEARHEAPPDDEPSAELIEAVEMTQSLDAKEAARGHQKIARLTTPPILKEQGFDPQRAQANALVATAYEAAVAELPELATFNNADLDAVVESTRTLKALANVGTAAAITEAMIGAGEILRDRKKAASAKAASDKIAAAADLKKKEAQRIVQSNARPASGDALRPHGASATKTTLDERLNARYDKEVARQGN